MTNPTDEEYADLKQKIHAGELANATRQELVRYNTILNHGFAWTHFAEREYPQVYETVRALLAVRTSKAEGRRATSIYQQAIQRTTRIAWIAIGISIVAAVASCVQIYFALAHR
jgi:hypothetical protein